MSDPQDQSNLKRKSESTEGGTARRKRVKNGAVESSNGETSSAATPTTRVTLRTRSPLESRITEPAQTNGYSTMPTEPRTDHIVPEDGAISTATHVPNGVGNDQGTNGITHDTSAVTENVGKRKSKKKPLKKSLGSDGMAVVKQSLSNGAISRVDADEIPESSISYTTMNKTSKEIESATYSQKQHGWNLSEPTAGRFADCPALLSNDETHLLVATEHAINVYSTRSSLLERSLPQKKNIISSAAFSSRKTQLAYVSTNRGLDLWDWKSSVQLGALKANFAVERAICIASESNTGEDLVFTVCHGTKWSILVHRFDTSSDDPYEGSHCLVTADKPIWDIKVFYGGTIVVLSGETGFLIGVVTNSTSKRFQDWEYEWREVACREAPISFDVQVGPRSKQLSHTQLDLAVGGHKGCIYVYRGLLKRLYNTSKKEPIVPQQLHWHREAVAATAWSKDGNYIVSGGREAVLVLWQLESGRKQFLPHLESSIESLVVSPSGSSYVVRLGDNSVMILSTSELVPTTNITGLQSLSTSSLPKDRTEKLTAEVFQSRDNSQPIRDIRACLRPGVHNDLTLAVPGYQFDSRYTSSISSAPYLQRFDLTNYRHAHRQALTRTNATHTSLGPEGTRIREPDVKHVSVSIDGEWLATIDEWNPPIEDLQDLRSPGDDRNIAELIARHRDVSLRFWRWQSQEQQWQLNSRIVTPHQLENKRASGQVLAMVSDPLKCGFATLGEDSVLRTWLLKSRLRDGRVVRGLHPKARETWWAAGINVPLSRADAEDPLRAVNPARAVLAFSNDGTCVAVHQHFELQNCPENDTVYFIDIERGEITETRNGLFSSATAASFSNTADEIHSMGFLDRYLIISGRQHAAVWDVPKMSLHAVLLLGDKPSSTVVPSSILPQSKDQDIPPPKLAINTSSRTFAIASHTPRQASKRWPLPILPGASATANPLRTYTSHIAVYSPFEKKKPWKPIFHTKLPRLVMTLLSADGDATADHRRPYARKGYLLVDAGATLRWLAPVASQPKSKSKGSAVEADTNADAVLENPTEAGAQEAIVQEDENLDEVEEEEEDEEPAEEDDNDDDEEEQESKGESLFEVAEKAVVPPEKLAAVFDHPPHAMPGMMELWKGVVALYAPKKT